MSEEQPGQSGTCWCCGDTLRHDVFELCIECEKVRAEVALPAEAVA